VKAGRFPRVSGETIWKPGPRTLAAALLAAMALAGFGCDEDVAAPDSRPPAFIHDLSAFAATRTSVTLAWTAPGDDWRTGLAAAYDVRYAETEDSLTFRFSRARWAPTPFAPSAPGSAETLLVENLSPGTRYYFAVKTADEVPNWSEISTVVHVTTLAPPDTTAPAAIDDLYVDHHGATSLTLRWRAPGDDGMDGYARAYDLRYSTVESSAPNWWEEWTEIVSDMPLPSMAGTLEQYSLSGLLPETTYYIALTATDEAGNTSDLSNIVTATTRRESMATFRLKPDGSGDFATIQEALTAAVSGDVIELAAGTYRGDGNRDLDFGGKALVLMTEPGESEPAVLDCEGSSADPHRVVIFAAYEGFDTLLENLVLRGGYAPPAGLPDTRYGGAVQCLAGTTPTFRNCRFTQNVAFHGGALFASGAAPRFEACVFIENEAESGGGAVYVSGEIAAASLAAEFYACAFQHNLAAVSGGALMFANGGSPALSDCTFEQNASPLGGALKIQSSAAVAFDDCRFASNLATGGDYPCGGAVHVHGDADAEFYNCTFEANGALDLAGAVYCTERGAALFEDCLFLGNVAGQGAALYCYQASGPTLRGCTFYDNTAAASSAAIVCRENSSPVLTRLLVAFTAQAAAIELDDTSDTIDPLCCDLYGNDAGNWTGALAGHLGQAGNISQDPQFCNAPAGDLRLAGGSPCSESVSGCGRIGALGVGCR